MSVRDEFLQKIADQLFPNAQRDITLKLVKELIDIVEEDAYSRGYDEGYDEGYNAS
jgi:hypothetical protein